jgi:DNA polymerase-3 subunit epsilon
MELPRLSAVPARQGLAAIVDVETTGFSADYDEVVELAIVLFAFDRATGQVAGIIDEYSGLRDPGRPIPPAAARVHGITDAMVAGQRLDARRIMGIVDRAEFIVAHNARFDCGFVNSLFPECADKRWLCSCFGINWRGHGHRDSKLATLLVDYDLADEQEHRGASDCLTTLALLALDGPDGQPNLAELLARQGLLEQNEQNEHDEQSKRNERRGHGR